MDPSSTGPWDRSRQIRQVPPWLANGERRDWLKLSPSVNGRGIRCATLEAGSPRPPTFRQRVRFILRKNFGAVPPRLTRKSLGEKSGNLTWAQCEVTMSTRRRSEHFHDQPSDEGPNSVTVFSIQNHSINSDPVGCPSTIQSFDRIPLHSDPSSRVLPELGPTHRHKVAGGLPYCSIVRPCRLSRTLPSDSLGPLSCALFVPSLTDRASDRQHPSSLPKRGWEAGIARRRLRVSMVLRVPFQSVRTITWHGFEPDPYVCRRVVCE